ncbi:MAG TPA: Ig-like domain-containing protein [Rhabdochlamydiaceae bacterium]|nr:Ig-like domain-containing protein [Rhabdochlamydiaceae bacterium]
MRPFRNISKLLALSLLLGMVSGLGSHLSADENNHGTGLIPPTPQEFQELDMRTLKVVGVRPNKVGTQRVQEYLQSKGMPVPPLTAAASVEEEFVTSLEWSPQDLKASSLEAILPSSVDNSKLPSFPPVGDQGAHGSCVAWATTYYGATHETGLINGYNNKTAFTHVLSPKWTYNLANWGNDGGTYIDLGYLILSQNGAPSILQFPYDGNYRAWDLNPQDWIDAINNRMQPSIMVPGLNGPQDLSTIKGMLNNGHILSIGTYAYSWNLTTIKPDPANPNSPYVGQVACTYMNGRNGGHNISIVGYDDNIWIDVNGNGQVDPGERGAFLLCNSWGPNWGNKGFLWVSYDAFLETSAVVNGPTAGRVGFSEDWGGRAFAQVAKAANYRPSLVGQFTISQVFRNQITIQGGVGGPSATVPAQTFQDTAIYNSGGAYAFNGLSASSPLSGTFALDFTDLIPAISTSGSQKYMLVLGDITAGNPTGLANFSLIDTVHNKTITNSMALMVDAGTQYPSVIYDFYNQPVPDKTPPTVAITSPTSGSTVANTVQVIANATDNIGISKVEFYVDSVLKFTDTSSPYMFSLDTTGLTNGNHNVAAIAYDPSNNSSTSAIVLNVQNTVPDKTPPTVAITSPATGSTVANTVQINATATDNVGVSKVEFYVDSVLKFTDTSSPYTFSLDTTGLSNGNHNVAAIAYDPSNNSSTSAIVLNVQNNVPDTTPPTVAITSPANGSTVANTVQITANATDNVGVTKVELYVDNGLRFTDTAPPYTFSLDTTGLTNGKHTIEATAYDAHGNWGTNQISVNVQNTVPDRTPPSVAITSPASGSTVANTVQITANATDNVGVSKVEFYVDNVLKSTDTSSPYTFTLDTTGLSNGNHNVAATAYDTSNNSSTVAIILNVQNKAPDTTPPTVAITSPPTGSTVSKTVQITATATDNVGVSRVECYVDSVLKFTDTAAPYTFSLDTTGLTNGTHNIVVVAYDTSNNSAASRISLNVQNNVPDLTPPTVAIASPKSGATVANTIQVSVNATDNVAVTRVELYVDNVLKFTDTAAPYTFSLDTTGLTNGKHTLEATAYDPHGNFSTAQIYVNVLNKVPDTTPPSVAITSPPTGSTVSNTVQINANATDNVGVSRVEFYVDSTLKSTNSAAPYTYSLDTTGLTNGSHSITVVAYDTSNNSAASRISLNVQNSAPDKTPPQVAFSSPTDGAVVANTVLVNANATDNVGVTRVELYIDNSIRLVTTGLPYGFSWDTTQVRDGEHTLTAKAYDAANNSTTTSVTVTVQN